MAEVVIEDYMEEDERPKTCAVDPASLATEMLKKRLDEAVVSNNTLKKENSELKAKLAMCLTPEQTQRLKNDNKRLLGLTERVNAQRSIMEERFKEKKLEVVELEKELAVKKEELERIVADRNKLKGMVENVLAEVDKHRDEIKVLKDGKSFADFVELKRQIKELKEENVVLSQGLNSDRKGSVYFNLNDLATMLHLKQGTTIEALSQRHQNQRVVVLDERELEESIRKGDHSSTEQGSVPACCRESPCPRSPSAHQCSRQNSVSRPLTSRQSSVNRINFISPPRSLVTSPRVFSRQCSREKNSASWNGSGTKNREQNGKSEPFHRKTTVFSKMAFTKRIKRAIPIGYARGLDSEAVYRRSLGIYKKSARQQ